MEAILRHRGRDITSEDVRFLRELMRGKYDRTGRTKRPLKDVLGYLVSRRFRERLGELA